MRPFSASADYLRLVEQRVLDAERKVVLQRERIERLRALGADLSDAQALLVNLERMLVVMQRHLHTETAERAMRQRFAVARALARQKLDDASTDEAVERLAALIVKGLFVERPRQGIALTVRALIESWRDAAAGDGNRPDDGRASGH